jgi:hypothetical protein
VEKEVETNGRGAGGEAGPVVKNASCRKNYNIMYKMTVVFIEYL